MKPNGDHIDLMMEDVAGRLSAMTHRHGHRAEVDRLETLYLRLYQSKNPDAPVGAVDDAEPFDGGYHHHYHHHHHHHHHHGHDRLTRRERWI